MQLQSSDQLCHPSCKSPPIFKYCECIIIIPSLQNVNAPPISNEVRVALEVLTIIGSVLSIVGLVITIFSMLYFK